MNSADVAISIKRIVFSGEEWHNTPKVEGVPLDKWESVITLIRDGNEKLRVGDAASRSQIRFEGPDRATVVKRTTEWLRDIL